MKTYISLIRGINVSGKKLINMKELKNLCESLNFNNVQTYIQSGNVIFEYYDTNLLELKQIIEKAIENTFGFKVEVLIKTKEEWQNVIENNPFLEKDPSKLHVTFLSDALNNKALDEINKFKGLSEEFIISEKEIYLFLPDGYGKTKLTNSLFEKKLKVVATTRNWNTVNKLFNMIKQ